MRFATPPRRAPTSPIPCSARDCANSVEAAVAAPGTAEAIFGGIDAIKLRSSLTLFAAVADDPAPFERGLQRFYAGEPDRETLRRLGD